MQYYLSLGANLGEREQTLRRAIECIEQQIGTVLRCSSFYYSEPWGFASENAFCNLCCAVQTDLAPLDMLRATQAIERQLGRTHKSVNGQYADRTIDIDIILAFDEQGNEVCMNHTETSDGLPSLIIPHPLYQQREFVTIPLSEILL